ncbi:conserved hypothetical protein [Ricinus communis]|uniref:Uncharacterized protein n=1 Tax=Ricinus communis TaxID=3988 RepID=B9S0V9_RICCO|nr:conserved hypothetical protein [Ricinus communis]
MEESRYGSSHVCLDSWQSLSQPKAAGAAWNLITNPQTQWAMLIRSLYFPNGDFWTAKQGSRPSWGWRSMLAAR